MKRMLENRKMWGRHEIEEKSTRKEPHGKTYRKNRYFNK